MMVVAEAKSLICWCACHGRWITLKRNISCYECIELCKKEGAHRIEYTCIEDRPPYNEVDYE